MSRADTIDTKPLNVAENNITDRGTPPPMLMGWYVVAYSDELAVGQVKNIDYFDTELVMWRGDDGVAHVNAPYCAHMGAHLGHGGTVVGANLQCPFHSWQFDGRGAVANIPYCKSIPPKLRKPNTLQTWPIVEANRQIHVWYHPTGEAPKWEVEIWPEAANPEWTDMQRFDWVINTHILDIAENQVDFAHFLYVHGTAEFPHFGELKVEGPRRSATAKAQIDTAKGGAELTIHSIGVGPGQGCVRFQGVTEIVNITAATPINERQTHVRFALTAPKSEQNSRLSKSFINMIVFQLNQDIPIWNNKQFVHQSNLVGGDGPILEVRKAFEVFQNG